MWAVTALSPPPPQCAEAGTIRILTRRRDEVGGRDGGRDVLMYKIYTHPVWVPPF